MVEDVRAFVCVEVKFTSLLLKYNTTGWIRANTHPLTPSLKGRGDAPSEA